MIRFLVVEPTHPGSSPRLGTVDRIFLELSQDFYGIMFSVVGDVPVDSETHVVTSSISRCAGTVFRRCS